MRFSELNLIEPLLRAVEAEGYDVPTPIQQQAIPHLLQGRDLVGLAQTGTGKTAAFALPILQRLAAAPVAAHGRRHIRVLILTPTRELASQIGDSFATYGKNLKLRHAVIFGGVGHEPQARALRDGIDILIATPGRLLDFMQQKAVRYDGLEVFVLDEADRMLDMGFIHDVRRVVAALPKQRQTLLFSATMPQEIRSLASTLLRDPITVSVTPPSSTAEKVEQSVYFIDGKSGKRALLEKLLKDPAVTRALVFTRTKHGANKVAEQLDRAGVQAQAIHGNKSQSARERALGGFKAGTIRVLVATDIAARGIDVDGISHVINHDVPNIPETYVHRIGRTARAGAGGIAISLCDNEERAFLHDIERLIRQRIPVLATPQGLPISTDPEPHREERPRRSQPPRTGRPQQSRGAPVRAAGGGNGNGQDRNRRPSSGGGGAAGNPRSGQPRTGNGGGGDRNAASGRPRRGGKTVDQVMNFINR